MNILKKLLILFIGTFCILLALAAWWLFGPDSSEKLAKRKAKEKQERQEQLELDRRRYESWFETPYKNIRNLSGDCVAWLDGGTCGYQFESDVAVKTKNYQTFGHYSCEEALEYFPNKFEGNEEAFENKSDLVCSEGKTTDGNDLVIVKSDRLGIYFVIETF